MTDEHSGSGVADSVQPRADEVGAKFGVVQFRPGVLGYRLSARGDALGGVAKRDLQRYYRLLSVCLEDMALSFWEAGIIAKTLMLRKFDPDTVRLIWAFVDDALERRRDAGLREVLDEADRQGEPVNAQALVAKLRAMNECQALAVYDAVEQYGRLITSGEADHAKALSGSGLYQDPDDLPF